MSFLFKNMQKGIVKDFGGVHFEKGLIMWHMLTSNSLYSLGFPRSHHPPASTSWLLRLQMCTSMPD